MYNTRSTATGKGMRGTRGIGGMLYSRECPQTFRGMSPNIPGNFTKHSRECQEIFWGMSPNNSGNVTKHSGECRQIFRRMLSNIPENAAKHSRKCRETFRRMSPNIPGNVVKYFGKNNLWHVVKHSVESLKGFRWMYMIALDTGDQELYLFVEGPLLIKSTSKQLC